MSPVRSRSRLSVAVLAGALLVSLLPATTLAATPSPVAQSPSTWEDTDLPIVLTGTDDDGDALTFSIDSQPADGSVTDPTNVLCDGNTPSTCTADVTYTPDPDTNGSDSFVFSVDDGSEGPATATVDITVDPVNDPPSSANHTVNTDEDSTYTFVVSDFAFSDATDSPADTLDAVKITSLPTAGVLTNGAAISAGDFVTKAEIQAGDLEFASAGNANGPAYATFTFQVRDDGGTANGGVDLDQSANTMTVDVDAVNDAPSGENNTVSTPEDTPYEFAESDFGFSDPNDTPADDLESVHITSAPADGVLRDNGVAVLAGDDVTAASINAGHLVFTPGLNDVASPYTTFTFQVEDDGGGTDLDLSANTMTIHVAPPVNDPPSGANKTVTILEGGSHVFVTGDFGFTDPNDNPDDNFASVVIASLPLAGSLTNDGTPVVATDEILVADINDLVFTPALDANGTSYASFTFQVRDDGGGSDLDPTPNTITLDVTGVNDAPAGTDKTVGIVEDTPYPFVTSDFGLTDTNDNPANTLSEVKIVTLPGAGSLTNNGVPYVAGASISAADITAGKLVFTPVTGANGDAYATLTFQVRDNGGTADGGVDLDPSANTITIDVGPVNNAPSGANKTVTTPEDVPYTLLAADFGFSDTSDSPADLLYAVKITTLPVAGTLRNNGATFGAGTFIPVADIAGNKLTFTPAANASGTPHATFTFQVQDDGGTVSGGVDVDPSANTISVNVTPRNDAPTGTNKTVTTNEEVAYTLVQADFGFGDASDSPANTLLAVKITTLPGVGTLRNNGVAVVAGGFVPVADITGNKLVFTPVLNGNGSPYATFTFQVQDNGGTANGGTDLDAGANTISVNVTPVQDAPDARTDATFTVPESAGATALAVLANDVEVDGETLLITAVIQPAHGAVAITGGGTGLTYDPTQLYFGTDSFTYTISDGHGGSDTATVLLTVVKDTVKPTVVGPAQKFYNQTVATKTSRAQIYWSGSDTGTGIKKYELAVSVSGGSFVNLALGSATATSLNITLTDEKSYKFRVRATDNQGNVSAWVNGPTFKPGRIQNNSTSVVYAGPWATVSTTAALGGSHRYASSLSARASVTRTTRDFALVMTKTSTSGLAEVRIDGVLAATINLHSTSTVYRQVVFSKHFGSLGSHTIEVRPIGGTRIYLDAFLVMR